MQPPSMFFLELELVSDFIKIKMGGARRCA